MMKSHQSTNKLAIVSPVMTKTRFCLESGLRDGQLRSQIERKNIPIVKVGKHTMVNVAKLTWNGISEDSIALLNCPSMTSMKFSLASGLTVGQVETQLSQSNLPRISIGRLVLVDVASLYRSCIEDLNELAVS